MPAPRPTSRGENRPTRSSLVLLSSLFLFTYLQIPGKFHRKFKTGCAFYRKRNCLALKIALISCITRGTKTLPRVDIFHLRAKLSVIVSSDTLPAMRGTIGRDAAATVVAAHWENTQVGHLVERTNILWQRSSFVLFPPPPQWKCSRRQKRGSVFPHIFLYHCTLTEIISLLGYISFRGAFALFITSSPHTILARVLLSSSMSLRHLIVPMFKVPRLLQLTYLLRKGRGRHLRLKSW